MSGQASSPTLDSGADLTPTQVAVLAQMNMRSVNNAIYKGGESGLRQNDDHLIPNAEARRWLEARRGFTPTRRYAGAGQKPQLAISAPTDYRFVPVAADGTRFSPALHRGEGFTIGPKGSEEQVADFDEALRRLQQMPVPYWRRPNPRNHWGLVRGESWVRVPLDELQSHLP